MVVAQLKQLLTIRLPDKTDQSIPYPAMASLDVDEAVTPCVVALMSLASRLQLLRQRSK